MFMQDFGFSEKEVHVSFLDIAVIMSMLKAKPLKKLRLLHLTIS